MWKNLWCLMTATKCKLSVLKVILRWSITKTLLSEFLFESTPWIEYFISPFLSLQFFLKNAWLNPYTQNQGILWRFLLDIIKDETSGIFAVDVPDISWVHESNSVQFQQIRWDGTMVSVLRHWRAKHLIKISRKRPVPGVGKEITSTFVLNLISARCFPTDHLIEHEENFSPTKLARFMKKRFTAH